LGASIKAANFFLILPQMGKKSFAHINNFNTKLVAYLLLMMELLSSRSTAQQANNWYFFYKSGINFNTVPPTVLVDGQNENLGSATISDNNGKLLFYSDAINVWNRQQQTMPNAFGLWGIGLFTASTGGNYSTTIPFPNDSNKYYLFLSESFGFPPSGYSCYNYSVVDIRLNGGLGDIALKNQLIARPSGERMTTVQAANGIESWFISLERGNLIFNTFKIGCSGISPSPIKDTFEQKSSTDSFFYISIGDMKSSFQNNKIGVSFSKWVDLYKFNNESGHLSNRIKLPLIQAGISNFIYDFVFSKNDKYLYTVERVDSPFVINLSICRYNLSIWDSATIKNSREVLYNPSNTTLAYLQLAPDDNIYFSSGSNAGRIENSNNTNPVIVDNILDFSSTSSFSAVGPFPKFASNLITNQNVQITSTVAADCRTVTLNAKTYIKGNVLSFKWKFGDGDSLIQNVGSGGDTTFTSIVHTYPLGVDTFFVGLTVTSDTVCGQGTAGHRVIVKPPRPTAKFGTSPIACGQLQVQFADSSLLNSNPSLNYQWAYQPANSNTTFINFSTAQHPSFTFATADSFSVRLIVSSALACVPSDSLMKTIYLRAKPTTAFTATNTCGSLAASFVNNSTVAGDTLQSYNWQFGNGQNSTIQNPVHTFATYGNKTVQLSVTSSRGCTSDTLSQTIAIKAKPNIGSGITADSICANTPYALSASASADSATINNYQWQLNGNAIAAPGGFVNQNIAIPGLYRYTAIATSSEGCVSDTAVILITIVGKPIAAFSFANNCGSKAVNFTSTAAVANDNISNYWWSFGDGSNGNTQNPTKDYSNFNSGYTVLLVAGSSSGCTSDTVTQTVAVRDKPTAALQYNGDACANTPFAITASSTVSNASISNHQWWINGMAIANNSTSLTNNQPAGNYRIQYLATSSEGCPSDTATQQLTIDAKPTAVFTTGNTCAEKNIPISNSSTGNIVRYRWLWGNGDSSLQQNPVYAYPLAGSYSITLQAITANGCTASSTQPITIAEQPIADFAITESCLGKAILLSNNSTGSSYIWQSSDGQTSNAVVPGFTYNTQGNYNLKLMVTGSFGCTDSSEVNFWVRPVAITATASDSIAIINQPVRLTATGAATYNWLPANLFVNNSGSSPIFMATNAGVYPITVTGITAQGCTGTAAIVMKVYAVPAGILLPNAFSPNGDGINEVLRPICTGLQRLNYFQVYNRYGQLLYQQQQCGTAAGWDGTVKGKKQNPGAFVYLWQGVDFNGRTVSGKGSVVLVR
jgi:gliding motility-associated-like protein